MNEKKWRNQIYYSQCWEDPHVLIKGLDIKKQDKIISITSGGCNTLAMLLKDPTEIIAIDINPLQNYLFELKICAIKYLPYETLLEFLGIESCGNRLGLYLKIKHSLSKEAQNWWDNNTNLITKGVVHIGKLERYFNFFSKFILPFIHSRKTVQLLFKEKSREDQSKFYNEKWNTWRWKFLCRLFFNKRLTSKKARNEELFKYVKEDNITNHYLEKIKNSICNEPYNNYFLYYILTGNYDKNNLPLYLRKENFLIIKERLDRINLVSNNVITYIKSNSQKYNKYNLSNIFETFSIEETSLFFKDIINYSDKGSRFVYINHLVDRTFSIDVKNSMMHDIENEEYLNKINMAFFYKKIHVDYIK